MNKTEEKSQTTAVINNSINEQQVETQLKPPSIKINFFLSILYQVLCVITPLITAPYLSRILEPEGVGIHSFTTSIQSFFCLVAGLGTGTYGSREIARNRDDPKKRSILFWEIELLSIFTSVVVTGCWVLFIIFSQKYKIYYIILTLGIFSTMVNISWFFTGIEHLKYTVTKNIIVRLVEVVLVFVFIKTEKDLYKYILINSTCGFLGALSMWLSVKRFLVKVKFQELNIFRHLKDTLVYFIPTIATSIYVLLDKTLIGLITKDEKQVGYYEQINKLIKILKALTFGSLNSIIGARSSYLFAHKKINEIKKRLELSIDYVMLIAMGSCFGLAGVASNFVPVFFGKGYETSIILAWTMSPVIMIIGISNCIGAQYYTPAGLRLKSAMYLIAGAIVNLVLNLLLIPKYKSNGAAIATLFAELVITVLYMANCKGYYTINQLLKCVWKKLIACLLMLSYILVIGKIIENPVLGLVVQISGGVVIYFVVLLILKDSFLDSVKICSQFL